MPKAKSNGIEIEYDCFGNNDAEAVLLISGLGPLTHPDDRRLGSQLAHSHGTQGALKIHPEMATLLR